MADVETDSVGGGFCRQYFSSCHVENLDILLVAVTDCELVAGRVGVDGEAG